MTPDRDSVASIPSVERLLRHAASAALIAEFGRPSVTEAIRQVLSAIRAGNSAASGEEQILGMVEGDLRESAEPTLRPVFNLSGTVLHTNLGRAPLPEEAIEAMRAVARMPANVEYDLQTGRRGDRDIHVEGLLRKVTGAEAATVVNNNAAAVLLVLNTLALRKEVPVSRGELIEIGGSFRMPDIMARSGCRLRETGTTNRTHLSDFAEAIGPKTGLVMKVHTSNYSIQGFTAEVPEAELAELCRRHGVPFAVDLGSGSLIDLHPFGLPHEPTVRETLAHGADLVTFSGDKLLGGPQAGIIVGRADLIAKIKRNPMKRALRVDKITIAALSAILRMYLNPDRLAARLPVLRLLTRSLEEIRASAERMCPRVAAQLGNVASVEVTACDSQIGSGALPTEAISSAGLAIRSTGKKPSGAALEKLVAAFRHLPMPVIGRLQEGALILDFRCLEDDDAFAAQLPELNVP